MVVCAFVAYAEVKLLHAFNLVADVLELTYRAVSGKTFHDVGEGICDIISLFGIAKKLIIVDGRIGDEDNGYIEDVDILFVFLDVTVADCFKVDSTLDCLLGNTNLLTMALGRHTYHVAFRIDMVFAELNVLESTVDLLVIALNCADADENDSCKRSVLLDFLEVGSDKHDLILAYQICTCGGADVVRGAKTECAELISSVALKNKLR